MKARAVVAAVMIVLSVLVAFQFLQKAKLLDHMVEESLAVDAIVVDQGWERISEANQGYRPWCISYRCPSVTRIYVVELPKDASLGGHLVPLIKVLLDTDEPVQADTSSRLRAGEWFKPSRACAAGTRCTYWGRSSRFKFHVTAQNPTNPAIAEREVAPGYVVVQVQVNIY